MGLDHDSDVLVTIPGNPPNMMKLPEGCPFAARCNNAVEACLTVMPDLVKTGEADGHMRACNVAMEDLV